MERWTLTVIDGSEQGLEKPLNEEIILGRSIDNDLVLSHSAVSRRHARIFAVGFVIYVEDLESTHGTKVNAETCSKRALNNNDIITVGPVSMKIACDQAAPNPEATNVIYVQPTGAPSIHEVPVCDIEKAVADHDISARLEAVLQIGLTLQGEREIGPLLQRIGETLINTLAVERCGIFLGEDVNPQLVMAAKGIENPDKLPFSKSLLHRAISDGEALVTADAGKDERVRSESVVAGAIRSAMVAPMWGREHVIGAVVVENRDRTNAFDSEDLRLLVVLANLAGTAFQNTLLIQEVRRETEERAALSRFFSPAVAEYIRSESGTALSNSRKEISVLFTDIRGFTGLSETNDPDKLVDLLNRYFHELTEAIFEVEGCVDKFTGDGVLALFGTPVAQSDHARRAVRAGQDILRRCSHLCTPDGEPLGIGIGIATGAAIVGPVGSEKRQEYTAIGNVVNIAARLVELANAGEVLTIDTTVEAGELNGLAEAVGDRNIKGLERELKIYSIDVGNPIA